MNSWQSCKNDILAAIAGATFIPVLPKRHSMMQPQDIGVSIVMTVFLIVGVYQFYFFTQNHIIKPIRQFDMKIDRLFKFKGYWVWFYSGLYYPMIVLIVLTLNDMQHYTYTAMSFFFLLFIQMAFFRYFPVETPPEWRDFGEEDGLSVRFMKLVQKYDDNTNCFPSMHVSVATLVAFHMWNNVPEFGYWPFAFPVIIALSALWTKQHYVVDVVAGIFPGWVAWEIYKWFIPY